jgi:hypothetical protein
MFGWLSPGAKVYRAAKLGSFGKWGMSTFATADRSALGAFVSSTNGVIYAPTSYAAKYIGIGAKAMAVCSRDSRAEVLKGRSLREYRSAMRDGFPPINFNQLAKRIHFAVPDSGAADKLYVENGAPGDARKRYGLRPTTYLRLLEDEVPTARPSRIVENSLCV